MKREPTDDADGGASSPSVSVGDAMDAIAEVPQEATYDGIAILGSHPAPVEMAPFDDDKWLIYSCSPHNVEMRQLPRWDEWFELHDPLADATRAYPYLKTVETFPLVWMRDQAALPYFKGGRLFPEEEVRSHFCSFMFTSSIAYIMAKAILDCEQNKIPRIGLWGIMQASENEYAYQRPGIQYFIWEATRRGIQVMAPKESRLFEPPENVW